MAEEGEACASVHLAFEQLGLGVDSFGTAVVVREREPRRGGVAVQVQAAGEGMYVGQVGGAGSGDPFLQAPGVARVRGQHGGEGSDQACQGGHLGAGGGESGEDLALAGGKARWPGEQEPGRPAR